MQDKAPVQNRCFQAVWRNTLFLDYVKQYPDLFSETRGRNFNTETEVHNIPRRTVLLILWRRKLKTYLSLEIQTFLRLTNAWNFKFQNVKIPDWKMHWQFWYIRNYLTISNNCFYKSPVKMPRSAIAQWVYTICPTSCSGSSVASISRKEAKKSLYQATTYNILLTPPIQILYSSCHHLITQNRILFHQLKGERTMVNTFIKKRCCHRNAAFLKANSENTAFSKYLYIVDSVLLITVLNNPRCCSI